MTKLNLSKESSSADFQTAPDSERSAGANTAAAFADSGVYYCNESQERSQLQQYCEMLQRKLSEKHVQLCETRASLGLIQAEFQTFALATSHDLQAPLRSITGFSHYLKEDYRGTLDKVANDYIDRIVSSAAKMKDQLAGLSNFAKVSSQAAPFEAVCLNAVLESAIAKHEQKIKDENIAVSSSPLPMIFGDRVQLETLFANLIDNCIKFRGSRAPQVSVASTKNDKKWLVTIEDSGIGIPFDQLDCVFKIFRCLDSEQSHRGVGLTVCRRIVERHSGRIYFCSKKRNGCKCIIELPAWSPP